MTYQEAIQKKQDGDWLTVAEICGITSGNARAIARRPGSKKYSKVMDTLVLVVKNREAIINQFK